jgi:hypothetical protein
MKAAALIMACNAPAALNPESGGRKPSVSGLPGFAIPPSTAQLQDGAARPETNNH